MADIYFISDPHFGHINMALKRGFDTVEEHDELIVSNWNKVITKRDVVYLLGDITMEKGNYDVLDRLNGIIKVVLGNHDMPQHVPKLLEKVNKVSGCIKWKDCILTHIPIHPMEIDRFRYNIHGHIHEYDTGHPKYINVSCETIGYTPRTFEELIEKRTWIMEKENSRLMAWKQMFVQNMQDLYVRIFKTQKD